MQRLKTLWKWLKPLIAVVVIALVIYYLYRQISSGWATISGGIRLDLRMAGGVALMALPPFAGPFIWWWLLKSLGSDIGVAPAFWAWSAANLGKYLPGKVWNIAGRFYFTGESKVLVAESIGLEVLANLWAGFLASATGLGFGLGVKTGVMAWVLVMGAVAGAVGLIWPDLIRKFVRLPLKLLKKEVPVPRVFPRSAYALAVAALYLIWLGVGVGLWLVLGSMGHKGNPVALGGAYALSWMAGYLFLLVPGGCGVREGTFSWLMGGGAPVALAAVVARLAITLWEIVAFVVAFALKSALKITRPQTRPPSP